MFMGSLQPTQWTLCWRFMMHGSLQVIKDLYKRLVQQGLRMICIITKVDLIDADIEADTTNVMFSRDVDLLRDVVSKETGMPFNQVQI
jgi:hypothetical protein